MCGENTQKPLCQRRWKGPTKPNHFISPNSLSFFVRRLTDVGCWDVTPLIESHNKDLVWTAPSIVHGDCNHPNNLAPWNIKWRRGSWRNLHGTLWSGGNSNKAGSHAANSVKVTPALPLPLRRPPLPPLLPELFWLQRRQGGNKSCIKDKYRPAPTSGFVCLLDKRQTAVRAADEQPSCWQRRTWKKACSWDTDLVFHRLTDSSVFHPQQNLQNMSSIIELRECMSPATFQTDITFS